MPFAAPGQTILTIGGRRQVVQTAIADAYSGADIVLDFKGVKNSGVPFYRVDGVTYASASAAGFTGTGTFDAAGYTATSTQVISATVNLPGDFIVYSQFVQPTTSANRQLWRHSGVGAPLILRSTTGEYIENPAAGGTSSSATKIAYGRSEGLAKVSFDGGAVTTGAGTAAPGSAALYIGNTASPFDTPFTSAIELLTIYKATLTDVQIQALGA